MLIYMCVCVYGRYNSPIRLKIVYSLLLYPGRGGTNYVGFYLFNFYTCEKYSKIRLPRQSTLLPSSLEPAPPSANERCDSPIGI